MSDFKSKLPDLDELTSMTTKLFKGIKKSVDEIIQDYKHKRAEDAAAHQATSTETPEPIVPPTDSPESPPVEKPVAPPENPKV